MEARKIQRIDADFPEKLSRVTPKISKLWYKGNWEEKIFEKCVAVVGSRKMSRYGKQVIGEIIPPLCEAGYTIVSGLMYGVDQEAHRAALESGGRTIAVLGYGIDAKQELGTRQIGERIENNGGLVISEYPSTLPPKRFMFYARNRIVVALSDIVIVVEASDKSGSLHTARMAIKQQKAIYSVPGSIFSPVSLGTNQLIVGGEAKLLTLSELEKITKTNIRQIKSEEMISKSKIASYLKLVGPSSINELTRGMGMSPATILSELMQLELKGVVKEERGVWKVV